MGCLTKEEIQKKDDTCKLVRVDVPEWGEYVNVRVITADERDHLEVRAKSGRIGLRAFFAAMCVCDDDGKDLFDNTDIEWLGKKSAAALDRILEAGQRLNGLTDDAVKELEKNSETIQLDNSGTD